MFLDAFRSVFDFAENAVATGHANLGIAFYVFFGVAAVNTALSAYYYLKVVRMMLLESPEGDAAETEISERKNTMTVGPFTRLYLAILSVVLFAAFIAWNPLIKLANQAADAFGLKR